MNKDDPRKKFWYDKNYTFRGRLLTPKLFKAEPKGKNQPKLVYKCGLMWLPEDEQTMAVAKELMDDIKLYIQNFYPDMDKTEFYKPIKSYKTYKRKDGQPIADFMQGHYWINSSTGVDFPPRVVDNKKQEVIAGDASIHSGRNALMNIKIFPYHVEGNVGVSTNLNAVQIKNGGDKVGGGSVNIDEVFGGFKDDMDDAKDEENSDTYDW